MWASRRVPGVVLGFGVWVVCSGVVWLVSGVGGLVWARFGVGWLVSGVGGVCAGVVWLVLVGVCWLVCVVWFRMLTCLASFFFLGFVSCLFCLVWLITGCFGFGVLVCVFAGVFWLLVVCGFVFVCGVRRLVLV